MEYFVNVEKNELHQTIRNSQLVPFQYSGHGAFWEERDRFNQLLMEII